MHQFAVDAPIKKARQVFRTSRAMPCRPSSTMVSSNAWMSVLRIETPRECTLLPLYEIRLSLTENYPGNPSMISTPLLWSQLMQRLATEMTMFPKALFTPLGPKLANAMEAVAKHLRLPADRILSGLPHPSGANAERIAFFSGPKDSQSCFKQGRTRAPSGRSRLSK